MLKVSDHRRMVMPSMAVIHKSMLNGSVSRRLAIASLRGYDRIHWAARRSRMEDAFMRIQW
jgi:hypothetical protein